MANKEKPQLKHDGSTEVSKRAEEIASNIISAAIQAWAGFS